MMKGLTKAILSRRVDELIPPFFCEIAFEKERHYIYGMLCVLLNEEMIKKDEYESIIDQVQSIKFIKHEDHGDSSHV